MSLLVSTLYGGVIKLILQQNIGGYRRLQHSIMKIFNKYFVASLIKPKNITILNDTPYPSTSIIPRSACFLNWTGFDALKTDNSTTLHQYTHYNRYEWYCIIHKVWATVLNTLAKYNWNNIIIGVFTYKKINTLQPLLFYFSMNRTHAWFPCLWTSTYIKLHQHDIIWVIIVWKKAGACSIVHRLTTFIGSTTQYITIIRRRWISPSVTCLVFFDGQYNYSNKYYIFFFSRRKGWLKNWLSFFIRKFEDDCCFRFKFSFLDYFCVKVL